MASKIKLVGKLNGVTTFTGIYDYPSCNFDVFQDTHENCILIALAVAAVIISAFDYENTTKTDGDANLTEETTKKSFGGASINFQDRDGKEFEADHLYIESTFKFDLPIPPNYGQNSNEIQFMFCNFPQISLTDEIY